MRGFIFLFLLFIPVSSLFSQTEDSSEDDINKDDYKHAIAWEIRELNRTVNNMIRRKNNQEEVERGKQTLGRYFYEPSGSFSHRFYENKDAPKQFQFVEFVDKLLEYDNVVYNWTIQADSVHYGRKVSMREKNSDLGWAYAGNWIIIREIFLTVKNANPNQNVKPEKYGSFIFPFKVEFRIEKLIEEDPELKIVRVKSTIGGGACTRCDTDGDGGIDIVDDCPFKEGEKDCKYCPPKFCPIDTSSSGRKPSYSFKYGLRPLIPSLGDYHCKPKGTFRGGWAIGVIASAGLGTKYYIDSKKLYPGNLREFGGGDFEKYRDAKLAKQNAYVFYSLAALIWTTDIIQSCHHCRIRKKQSLLTGTGDLKLNWGYSSQVYHVGDQYYYSPSSFGVGLNLTF